LCHLNIKPVSSQEAYSIYHVGIILLYGIMINGKTGIHMGLSKNGVPCSIHLLISIFPIKVTMCWVPDFQTHPYVDLKNLGCYGFMDIG
jgi:hypothetical protein